MEGTAAKSPDKVVQKPPFRKVNWLPRDIAVERRPDGVIVLKSRIPLGGYLPHIPAALARWAVERPDQTWLAQRRGPQRAWHRVSYAQASRGDAVLAAAIEKDDTLCRSFFKNLSSIAYGGARLPDDLYAACRRWRP